MTQVTFEAGSAAKGAPGPATAWTDLPLDVALGESLGSLATRRAFSAGIAAFSRPAFASCFKDYVPPTRVDHYQLQVELRLVAGERDFLVEDALPLEATYGDEPLERCILNIYKGKRIAATPEAAARHRLRWTTVKYFQ